MRMDEQKTWSFCFSAMTGADLWWVQWLWFLQPNKCDPFWLDRSLTAYERFSSIDISVLYLHCKQMWPITNSLTYLLLNTFNSVRNHHQNTLIRRRWGSKGAKERVLVLSKKQDSEYNKLLHKLWISSRTFESFSQKHFKELNRCEK